MRRASSSSRPSGAPACVTTSSTAAARISAATLPTWPLPDYKPQRATVMVDYSWSEFSRARLQYAQDKSMQGVTDNQLTLQYIMSLGAHGAHTF